MLMSTMSSLKISITKKKAYAYAYVAAVLTMFMLYACEASEDRALRVPKNTLNESYWRTFNNLLTKLFFFSIKNCF